MPSPLATFNIEEHVIRWVQNGGYLTLFGLLFACGLGLPLPEDIPLLAAGYMIYIGKFKLFWVAICAWSGIIGGDCVLYNLGRRFGLEVTKVPFIGNHLTLDRIYWVEARFKRYGIWVVAVGRMLAGIRGAMVVCAGTIRYPFWKFLLADGLAAIVSGGLFIALGYWFGNRMDALRANVAQVKSWVLLALIIAGIGFGAWIWFRRSRHRHDPAIPPLPSDKTLERASEPPSSAPAAESNPT